MCEFAALTLQAHDPFASSAQLLPVQPEARPQPRPQPQPVRVPTGMRPPLAGPLPSIFGEPLGEYSRMFTCARFSIVILCHLITLQPRLW